MKKIFTIFLLLVTLGLSAQNYNNEWIDYSKTYYKFKVGATGLYRIPASVLAAAGLGSATAQSFQLFRNGKEVPVYTSVASGTLSISDYIEFWGQINDGVADKPLYRNAAYQHTDHWSLETDTAVYFLTTNSTGTPFHFTNTVNDTTGTPLSPEPFFMHKAGNYYKDQINLGFAQVVGEYVYSSSYDIGEFWSSNVIGPAGPLSNDQNNLYAYNGGPNGSLRFGMVGNADNPRSIQVKVNGSLLIDTLMNNFNDLVTSRTVPLAQLTGGTASFQFLNNSTVSTDRMVVSFYELTYPRQFNFDGQNSFSFELPAKGDGYFLKINNFNVAGGGGSPVLYDLTNGLRYTALVGPGSTLSFLLGGSGATRKLVLVNEDVSNIRTVNSMTSRTFTNFANPSSQANYIIISNPLLYTGSNGNNPVTDYKNYRNSVAGGNFNTQVYDIGELIEQFSFGIKIHPLSIQNFLRYARAVFVNKPQYVLLIGHGMCYTDYNTYGEGLHSPMADRLDLVPTFGYPASDNKLAAASGGSDAILTPIGRLSVISGPEIEIYLNKLKEYEQVQVNSPNTVDGRLWMKSMMHVTGASEPYLGAVLCNYMSSYKAIVSDTLFGGSVTTFCKTSSSQIEQFGGPAITKMFNDGFSIMNYFGHSSNTSLGYDLDDPTIYNNAGKYPVFYINGCDAGNFFVYDVQRVNLSKALSETYVLAKERGSIAFVASTHFGIVNYLNIFLYNLYNLIDGQDYGKSIGTLQKDALLALYNTSPTDFFVRQHIEQITIHGDPALKLNQSALPDYDIEEPQVRINPQFVSVADASFSVNAHFYNLGKAVKDSVFIQVSRKYPDGTSVLLLRKKIKGIRYDDSVQLDVPIVATRDKGQNYITVSINPDNITQEITLANNSTTVGVYVYEDLATPIYPYNYSIINNRNQKLYASTSNPFTPSQQYVMEIDTTTLFNSSAKISKNLTTVGGVLEFDAGASYMDSVVYYWRVARVPVSGSVYKWTDFSFVFIDSTRSKAGFNQSHFYQHTESSLNGLFVDSASRTTKFSLLNNNLFLKNGVFPTAANVAQDISVLINGNDTYIQSVCGVSTILVNVFDPNTFHPWYNANTGAPGRFGSLSPCGTTRRYYFIYNILDTAQRRSLMNFLDYIPTGAIVTVMNCSSWQPATNTYAADWKGDTSYLGSGNSIYHRLYQQGFTGIDSFYKPRAFIFVYQKNMQSNFTPKFVVSDSIWDKISLSADFKTPDSVGYALSPKFGPAKQWHDLHWRGQSLESPSTDSVNLQVIGVDTSGNSTPLYNLGTVTQDYDISGINAVKYPYVQLKLGTRDTLNATPYQLKYWRVTYDPVPEGALAPNVYLSAKDTLVLGEMLNFGIAFKNVSPIAFDSMRIKLNIIDRNNVTHVIVLPKKKPLISGDTLMVNYQINTRDYPGSNTIYLDVNPDNAQPEEYHFNNFLYKNFYVYTDSRNPSLDVTFDNVHILNEDIVSAKPHIQVKLKSPSQHLLLTDTSLMTVQLKYPDGSLHTYNYSSDTLRFLPATTGSDNTATIDFTPVFTKQYNPEGDEYQLIVTGKDELGNQASTIPYRVSFKVISKPMISNMLNYPNPFTTSTAFVFTITGSDVPQNIKIQILTITGKIVREITKDELGPLHVGRNITEFKWNGTDSYGQRLANGVYLYHVVTNLNGHSVEKYKAAGDNTDKYFNNGYGKMYLMK